MKTTHRYSGRFRIEPNFLFARDARRYRLPEAGGVVLSYDVRGEAWCIALVFSREVDAEMARAALEKAGITPQIYNRAPAKKREEFRRIAIEALQW